MIKSIHMLSLLLLLAGALSYTQNDDDDGLMQQVGKKISPYVPEAAKKWYKQRQEEEQKRTKQREQERQLDQVWGGHPYLSEEEKSKLLESLLDRGLDPNKVAGAHGWKAHLLMIAANAGKKDWVDRLLKAGARPNDQIEHYGESALYYAIDSKKPESAAIVSSLLEAGANPDIQTGDGNTLLHHAVRANRPDIVEILLAHGANPNIENREGQKPADFTSWHMNEAQQKIAEGQEHLQKAQTIQSLLEQKN